MKIKWWCDSGANIHSCVKGEVTLEELGYTREQWDTLPEKYKEEVMKSIAFEKLDWGYCEED